MAAGTWGSNTDAAVVTATTYTYQVRAASAAGNSALSNRVSVSLS